VSGRAVKPTKGEKRNQILVQLERSSPGQDNVRPFPVEVVYFTKGQKFEKGGKLDVFLPKSDIPTSELFWSCWLPDEYKYSDFKGNVKEWKEPPPPPRAAARPEEGRYATQTTRSITTKEIEAMPSPMAQNVVAVPAGGVGVGSNVNIPQVQMERDARQMFAQKGRAEGVFPVKVQIPERGKFYRFTKLLVTDEVPELIAKYKK
jgi:hypothetical protein